MNYAQSVDIESKITFSNGVRKLILKFDLEQVLFMRIQFMKLVLLKKYNTY